MPSNDIPIPSTRRHFIKGSLAAGTGAVAALGATTTAARAERAGSVSLKKRGVVLFQGDSITDAGRNKKNQSPNNSASLGRGYPHFIAAYLLLKHADLDLQVSNRGVSGNKVPDLDARWQADCIDLKPDVLSILIGVNDIWHAKNGRYDGTVETYGTGFAALLKRTRKALPDVTLVICDPFVMRCGAVKDDWFPEFDERRAAARRVSDAAGAIWVPLQAAFDAAIARGTEPAYWAGDGVHPSVAGHGLISAEWLKATGLMG